MPEPGRDDRRPISKVEITGPVDDLALARANIDASIQGATPLGTTGADLTTVETMTANKIMRGKHPLSTLPGELVEVGPDLVLKLKSGGGGLTPGEFANPILVPAVTAAAHAGAISPSLVDPPSLARVKSLKQPPDSAAITQFLDGVHVYKIYIPAPKGRGHIALDLTDPALSSQFFCIRADGAIKIVGSSAGDYAFGDGLFVRMLYHANQYRIHPSRWIAVADTTPPTESDPIFIGELATPMLPVGDCIADWAPVGLSYEYPTEVLGAHDYRLRQQLSVDDTQAVASIDGGKVVWNYAIDQRDQLVVQAVLKETGQLAYYVAQGQRPQLVPEPDSAVRLPIDDLITDRRLRFPSDEARQRNQVTNISGLVVYGSQGQILHRVSLSNLKTKGGWVTRDGIEFIVKEGDITTRCLLTELRCWDDEGFWAATADAYAVVVGGLNPFVEQEIRQNGPFVGRFGDRNLLAALRASQTNAVFSGI